MTSLNTLTVLVVDDDPFMRVTIKAVLRAVGCVDVTEAENGDAALVEVDKRRPDVVLCDIVMPGTGGLQFVEQLRQHHDAQTRDTPVLMLTGHTEGSLVRDAMRLKIAGYLIKPVSPELLAAQLEKIVARRGR
jgi:CheY-like chemotaxis protein